MEALPDLFHYTTRDAAFGHILPSGQLRLSSLHRMRDPLENKRWGFAGSFRPVDETASERARAAWIAFHHYANEIRTSAKLLSLTLDSEPGSRTADEAADAEELFARGWSRARMWEQYAERHAGVCLVFDHKALRDAVVGSLRSQGLADPYYRPVVYSASAFQPMLDLGLLIEDASPETVRQWVQEHNDALFFKKTPDWQTENEYRFVATLPDAEYVYADFGEALKSVIVGERFPAWQRAGAASMCADAGAKLQRLDWSTGLPLPHAV
jgi:hypothetical protein